MGTMMYYSHEGDSKGVESQTGRRGLKQGVFRGHGEVEEGTPDGK